MHVCGALYIRIKGTLGYYSNNNAIIIIQVSITILKMGHEY